MFELQGSLKFKIVRIGLILTVVFQLGVLTWKYLGSVWPLWFGEKVILETEPVDPRSLFRGNYVWLQYAISDIEGALAKGDFQKGEVAYVTLVPDGEFYRAANMVKEKPTGTLFIRGRVTNNFAPYRLDYGIEAFFMPKEKAIKAERTHTQATIYLLSNGKAAIADLTTEDP